MSRKAGVGAGGFDDPIKFAEFVESTANKRSLLDGVIEGLADSTDEADKLVPVILGIIVGNIFGCK